jgi:hypothetical protein
MTLLQESEGVGFGDHGHAPVSPDVVAQSSRGIP